MQLFRRHLLTEQDNEQYSKYDVERVTYCLMGNHFHLLSWQGRDVEAITKLIRSVSTAYAMYFNYRHKQQGHLFQSIFKASHTDDESYLVHISRYIHLNLGRDRTYYWSSMKEYLGERSDNLIHPERVLDITPGQYLQLIEAHKDRREVVKVISDRLANV